MGFDANLTNSFFSSSFENMFSGGFITVKTKMLNIVDILFCLEKYCDF